MFDDVKGNVEKSIFGFYSFIDILVRIFSMHYSWCKSIMAPFSTWFWRRRNLWKVGKLNCFYLRQSWCQAYNRCLKGYLKSNQMLFLEVFTQFQVFFLHLYTNFDLNVWWLNCLQTWQKWNEEDAIETPKQKHRSFENISTPESFSIQ